jgi:hypothetical protein
MPDECAWDAPDGLEQPFGMRLDRQVIRDEGREVLLKVFELFLRNARVDGRAPQRRQRGVHTEPHAVDFVLADPDFTYGAATPSGSLWPGHASSFFRSHLLETGPNWALLDAKFVVKAAFEKALFVYPDAHLEMHQGARIILSRKRNR